MGGDGAVFFYTHPQPFGREDVWQVDVSGIPLGLDETTDPYDPEDSWWCTYDHDIPRERMKLIHRAPSKVVESAETVTVYHGTCSGNAASLCANGWVPNSGAVGGNQGQARFLYLSTGVEDAEWFANEKGCTTVLAVTVPMAYLIVDPEDGIGDTLEDEINNPMGLPGKVALTRPVGPEAFKVVKP